MKNTGFSFQPVIIIGAARSGTNMLRDMLTRVPGVSTWPCDEINYVWRHLNATVPHDEFTPDHARPAVRRYIRREFEKRARHDGCRYLVEKTCANSLRVGFVDAVVPEAKYVFLVRDGRDVVVSAMRRWTAPLDPKYVFNKARFVPPSDLAYYAVRYLMHRTYRMFSMQKRLSTWGPRFLGMRDTLTTRTLEEVCAMQWARSVESAAKVLDQIGAERTIQLKYESLVQKPEKEFTKVLEFLSIEGDFVQMQKAVRHVSPLGIGNWRAALTRDAIDRITPIVEPQLALFGFNSEKVGRRMAA